MERDRLQLRLARIFHALNDRLNDAEWLEAQAQRVKARRSLAPALHVLHADGELEESVRRLAQILELPDLIDSDVESRNADGEHARKDREDDPTG